LDQEILDIIKKDEEDTARDQKAHEDQVQYLRELNLDYKKELEQLLSTGTGEKWAYVESNNLLLNKKMEFLTIATKIFALQLYI